MKRDIKGCFFIIESVIWPRELGGTKETEFIWWFCDLMGVMGEAIARPLGLKGEFCLPTLEGGLKTTFPLALPSGARGAGMDCGGVAEGIGAWLMDWCTGASKKSSW